MSNKLNIIFKIGNSLRTNKFLYKTVKVFIVMRSLVMTSKLNFATEK